MKKHIKRLLGIVLLLTPLASYGQKQVEMADGMRAEGKIYVVVAIILIVLIGLVLYLVLLDKKVKELKDLVNRKNSQTK